MRDLDRACGRSKSIRRLTRAMYPLLGGLLSSACDAPRAESRPVALEVVSTSHGSGLRLNASPGVKINARLKPALELASGGNITFDAARLTPDSAYFAEPPSAEVPAARTRVAGTLRVSVCLAAASYCQTVEIPIDLAIPRS